MKEQTAKLRKWEQPAIGTPTEKENAAQPAPETDRSVKRAGKKTSREETKEEEADYYRAAIKADKKVFADEVVKHDMLSHLWKQSVRWNYEVIAFTLLDDQLHLILARRGKEHGQSVDLECGKAWRETDPDKEILEDLRRESRELYGRTMGRAYPVLRETSSWEKLEKPSDLLRECCDIHQMPVRNGYVDKASQYWWSSYTSYRGRYYWKFLNCSELLDRFSPDPAKASAMFCKEQSSYSRKDQDTDLETSQDTDQDTDLDEKS